MRGIRRAGWRRHADDPKILLGWWWRGVTETRLLGWRVFLCLLGAILILTQTRWGMVPIALNFALIAFEEHFRRPDDLLPLLPDPPPLGEFRARVSYHRDGMTTGTDEMALVVVDGWLVADGVRSHFALRGIDVGRITGMGDLTIRLPLADGSDVRFQNIRDREGRVHVPHALFKAWQKQAEVVEGEPTFPPARPHPQAMVPWAFWSCVGTAGIFLPSLIASWLHADGRFSEVRFAFTLMFFGASWLSWRQMERLARIGRRAEREDERNALAGQAPPLQSFENPGAEGV